VVASPTETEKNHPKIVYFRSSDLSTPFLQQALPDFLQKHQNVFVDRSYFV
jgi:hypothetical protein